MKLSSFEKIIRKVIREEIDHALRREIALLKEELKQYSNEQIDKILDIQDKISEKKDIIKQMQKEKKKTRQKIHPINYS